MGTNYFCEKCKNVGYLKHYAVIVINYFTLENSRTSTPKKFTFASSDMVQEANSNFRKIYSQCDSQVRIIENNPLSKFISSASHKLIHESLKDGRKARLLFQELNVFEACVMEVVWKGENSRKRKFWVVVHEDVEKSSVRFGKP